MSTSGQAATLDAPKTNSAERESVALESLIVGRELRSPIYDTFGRLLLAEGSRITSEVKRRLREHDIQEVMVHSEDLSHVTLAASLLPDDVDDTLSNKFSNDLDKLIESGGLFVRNDGEAIKERMRQHGCRGYDEVQRAELIEKHEEVSRELDSMMQNALHGGQVAGSKLAATTGQYLTAMLGDAENVLTVASEVGHDPSLSEHCLQMSLLGMAIGVEMGLDETNVRTIGICGLVHDWGMIRVPEEIRLAERILTSDELVAIKKHPVLALEMLQKVSGIPKEVPIVCYQLHERPNGKGYPRERRKDQIHPFARILNVADAYLALTSPRPFRPALMPYAAMECLLTQSGQRQVDGDVVRHLLHILSLFPLHSFVVLTDGSTAQVLRRDGNKYATPIVRLIADKDGNRLDKGNQPSVIKLGDTELRVAQALPTPGRKQVAMSQEILNMSSR
ncbi:MAG: HD domain-containing protein [Planctomycetaceae bacterium]|nr:HD domain-containing protein [Planctomycetales bacterium]MCB9927747.1 HD domain-containing protein [Planctomycetaceae bacterium]